MLAIALIAAAFGCGWLSYGNHHARTRTFGLDFAAEYVIPSGFGTVSLLHTDDSTGFVPGDRIDLLIVNRGQLEPLILDAVVTRTTQSQFSVLVRPRDSAVISRVRERKYELVYRHSIVPSGAEYTSEFREAQKELDRIRKQLAAEGIEL
jgi:hypothetical protein